MQQHSAVPSTLDGASKAVAHAAGKRGDLYLAFALGGESFAIDIARTREILEYNRPTIVPMTPPSVLGVINVRGSVVPVVDLAVRFGWPATTVGRRTSIVIVEIDHRGSRHVLGLVVDRVNAVTAIKTADIEPSPAFGANIDTEYIAGMARIDGRFVILLNIARTLSIDEMAAIASVGQAAAETT